MKPVFADTSYYAELLHERDRMHENARKIWLELKAPVVTTEFVLSELGSLLRRGDMRSAFVRFIQEIRSDPTTTIEPASSPLFDGGFDLFANRADKEWSLVDCTSFFEMKRRGISDASTSDEHFAQAGFHVLLSR